MYDYRVKEVLRGYFEKYSKEPIITAALDGKFEILKILVESGGNVNSVGEYGWNK